MCGIAGIFDHSGRLEQASAEASVRAMCARLQHRGPDADGLWASADGRCVLGHRRLSVIDLDVRSNQPMQDASGRYLLTFNGEIYNFRVLRLELQAKGIRFRTTSDTEVLIEGYREWGKQLFQRLDGMFALAIYDTQDGRLILARDRIGEKPLYFAAAGGRVAFASELKALLAAPGIARTVSRYALHEYFVLRYVADPATIFADIRSVQPGTLVEISNDGATTEHSLFAFDLLDAESRPGDHKAYLDRLEAALVDSVRTRLVSDVPLGAFLSSGVDSSLVCALAARRLGHEIRCYCAGFVDDKDNENERAQSIAEHLGLPFESYLVSPADLLELAGSFGSLLDEPNGDRSCVPTYLLARFIRQRETVALSGDGGDELFGGYGRYAGMRNRFDDSQRPDAKVERYFQRGLPVFPTDALAECFPEMAAAFRRRVANRFAGVFVRRDLDDIERMRLIDVHSYLPGAVLAKVDRMSMRNSLEVRTPFFSPELLKLSASLPLALSIHGDKMKVALRTILARHVPATMVLPTKQGFGMPGSFFRTHEPIFAGLADRADEVLGEWLVPTVDPAKVPLLRKAARANINSLWAWIALGQWAESLPA